MNAKEMFEKIGYEIDLSYDDRIRYINDENRYYLIFELDEEIYTIGCRNWLDDVFINMSLLQAINKQIEELGWLKGEKDE